MNKSQYLIQANVENLLSLWSSASIPFQAYFVDAHFSYCLLPDSQWPNRIWLKEDLNVHSLSMLRAKLSSLSTPLILPYFDIYASDAYQLLEKAGFEKLFEQRAMCLKLDELQAAISASLQLKKINGPDEAQKWSDLFLQAFGYRIHPKLLCPTGQDMDFLIALEGEEAVGTALLHRSENIAGIHCVGIIPEKRKKGFAGQLMKVLLRKVQEEKLEYATLQASEMGKGLYLKLGFQEQFSIKNYILPGVI